MSLKNFFAKHSENIGGAVSLVGSTALLLNGDIKSVVATGLFTAAELTLAFKGHKTGGYAAGAVGFAVGDFLLAASVEDPHLRRTLIAMGAAWTVGALRYPFEAAARNTKAGLSQAFQKTADVIPAVVGTVNLALRVPGIAAAVKSGNHVLTTAISCWGASDILTGRLQQRAGAIWRGIKNIGKDTPPPPAPV